MRLEKINFRQKRVPTVFLTNGSRVKESRGFDRFTITLEYKGKQQSRFKHAVSMVIAQRRNSRSR